MMTWKKVFCLVCVVLSCFSLKAQDDGDEWPPRPEPFPRNAFNTIVEGGKYRYRTSYTIYRSRWALREDRLPLFERVYYSQQVADQVSSYIYIRNKEMRDIWQMVRDVYRAYLLKILPPKGSSEYASALDRSLSLDLYFDRDGKLCGMALNWPMELELNKEVLKLFEILEERIESYGIRPIYMRWAKTLMSHFLCSLSFNIQEVIDGINLMEEFPDPPYDEDTFGKPYAWP